MQSGFEKRWKRIKEMCIDSFRLDLELDSSFWDVLSSRLKFFSIRKMISNFEEQHSDNG